MKTIILETKSKHLQKGIDDSLKENCSLWKTTKRLMNWDGDGPPRELRDEDESVVSKPGKMADIFYLAMEKKTSKIM